MIITLFYLIYFYHFGLFWIININILMMIIWFFLLLFWMSKLNDWEDKTMMIFYLVKRFIIIDIIYWYDYIYF